MLSAFRTRTGYARNSPAYKTPPGWKRALATRSWIPGPRETQARWGVDLLSQLIWRSGPEVEG